ncbi:MAG: Rpn family recombination-promoting nuclease/putative transposase [Cyanobacteriota bacterium]
MKELIRFDWAIKNILRDKSNFVILEGFLSELLKEEVKIIEIIESESNKGSNEEKLNRVDLIVKLQKGEFVIIEIQNQVEYDYLQRILYGVSKTISENLKIGKAYKSIKKVISVSIVYFDLGYGTDYVYHGTTNFVGIHNQDKLELSPKQKKLFKKEEAKDVFPEYYILKVENFDKKTKDGLDEWIYFLKTDEIMETFKAKGLKEAKKKLDVLKMNKEERAGYNSYLKDLHLKASLADTQQFDLDNAKEECINQRNIEIVINGNKKGYSNDVISDLSGLTIKEIEEILKNAPRQEKEE